MTRCCPARRTRAGVWLAALGALLLGGCAGTTRAPSTRPPQAEAAARPPPVADEDRPVPEGTPRSRAQAAEAVARFEDESGAERVAAARRLAAMGEQALRPLFDALERGAGPRTRGMAAYTLGFMDDRRAVEPLARASSDPVLDVRLDAAAALLRLGDDRGFPPLIQGLDDADPRVRARCIGVLHGAVSDTFGFEPDGDPQERRAAVARWRGWLERRREGGS